MKNYKSYVLLGLLIFSCTGNIPANNVTPSPVTSSSAPLPSSSPSASVEPSTFPLPSDTSSPVPSPSAYEEVHGLFLMNGYIKSPASAFLDITPFNLESSFVLTELPVDDQIMTIFSVYDNESLNEHFKISIDHEKNLLLHITIRGNDINEKIAYPSLAINQKYFLSFIRESNNFHLRIDNVSVIKRDLNAADFVDLSGRRTLNLGADAEGNNRLKARIDYVKIENALDYQFKNNFMDQYKYNLDAIGIGEYEFVKTTAEPMPSPSSIPLPSATPTPIYKEDNGLKTGQYQLNLNVIQDNNCVVDNNNDDEDKTVDEQNSETNDCILIKSGNFTSSGINMGDNTLLSNDHADMSFVSTYFEDSLRNLVITGNNFEPKVFIVDVGEKNFEGVDEDFLKTKILFNKTKQYYSDTNFSSPVVEDHVYGIKTLRYGKEPRYAKVLINKIMYNGHSDKKFPAPDFSNLPDFVNAPAGSGFKDGVTYDYYAATYDGIGETIPEKINSIGPIANANTKKVKMTFKVPYRGKGYIIYRHDTGSNEIHKIGPILVPAETDINLEDNNISGTKVDSLPVTDTTARDWHRPDPDDFPIRIDLKYVFYGLNGSDD